MSMASKYDDCTRREVYMNGRKVFGVQAVEPVFDVNYQFVTLNLSLLVLKDSLKIDNDSIRFDVDWLDKEK